MRNALYCCDLHAKLTKFTEFAGYFRRLGRGEWPVVLLDLPGRGRADDRARDSQYSSLTDARDVAAIMTALGIGKAVVLGQGHGGQVAMALAASHPLLIAGTVLLDAGPVTDSRGIVRLRNNLAHIDALRGARAVTSGFRKILGGDYPGLPDDRLDALAGRSHLVDKRGRARPLFDQDQQSFREFLTQSAASRNLPGAMLIDKDRSPRWRHARIEDVTEAEVAAFFASLGDGALALPDRSAMQSARI